MCLQSDDSQLNRPGRIFRRTDAVPKQVRRLTPPLGNSGLGVAFGCAGDSRAAADGDGPGKGSVANFRVDKLVG